MFNKLILTDRTGKLVWVADENMIPDLKQAFLDFLNLAQNALENFQNNKTWEVEKSLCAMIKVFDDFLAKYKNKDIALVGIINEEGCEFVSNFRFTGWQESTCLFMNNEHEHFENFSNAMECSKKIIYKSFLNSKNKLKKEIYENNFINLVEDGYFYSKLFDYIDRMVLCQRHEYDMWHQTEI